MLNVIKTKKRFDHQRMKPMLVSAIALACHASFAQSNEPTVSEHSHNSALGQSYSWLAQQPNDRYTMQIGTVYGLTRCQRLTDSFTNTTGLKAFCYESSSVANRYFAISGSYSTMADVNNDASQRSITDYWVNSLDRIKDSRCDLQGIPPELAKSCDLESSADRLATSRNAKPIVGQTVSVPSQSNPKDNQFLPALIVPDASPSSEEDKAPSSESVTDLSKAELFEAQECSQANDTPVRQRRRPGYPVLTYEAEDCRPNRLDAPRPILLADPAPVPDRWRIVDSLGYEERWWDPYNGNNTLKGDKPIFGKPGKDWFFNLSAISDTVYEPRKFPVPVGAATTSNASQLDLLGKGEQYLINENLIVETVLYRGDTVFRPPDHEFRLITVFNINHTVVDELGLLKADPAEGTTRTEGFIGIQGAFWDYHIRNVSDRYDFDSFRIGIQPFSSDFRGFLFQDNQFGVRLFGTRNNNIFQYNLAWFRRMEKEINSGLNDIADSLRDDDIFTANLFWQDFPSLGFVSQASITHNRNREAEDFFFDDNSFIARPSSLGFERGRDYDVTYLGLSGDGHFGRNNLTYSAYYAFGDQSNGVFTNEETDIDAYFFAAELSRDYDWIRAKASFLHTSGDDNPFDNKETGFDAIFENPQFAGGDTAFFIRQGVPLIGGGRVALNGRNSIIPSLRSSKELGQSNFTNPGLTLFGLGADFDITPQTRLSLNLNQMWFEDTSSLELARNQTNIRKNIGQDLSAALIWRPLATQNVVFRLSGAVLNPGSGFVDLYGDKTPYSVLANLILAY